MPKLVLDSGLTLHYQQVGDGPDVVMVHGSPATWPSGTCRSCPRCRTASGS